MTLLTTKTKNLLKTKYYFTFQGSEDDGDCEDEGDGEGDCEGDGEGEGEGEGDGVKG